MSTATTRPSPARLAAAATMNEPIPPVPMTATASPAATRTRDTAWRATANGCVIAAASSSTAAGTRRQIASGELTRSANPPFTCRPSVRYSAQRFVRPRRHQRQRPQEIPAPETTRSPTRSAETSPPTSTTRPTNSWPSTTPGRQRIGPWSHSEESVPQMAARTTSSTTSAGAGAGGSAISSIRTSRGPWKTAALTLSALDLDLHVTRGISGRVEGGRALVQREGGSQERRRIDAAARHEPDRPRPHARRADDAAYLKSLGLDEPELDV